MIIVGYQGIGKSSLAGKGKYIDLESSNFWINGKRDDNWYIPYCNIAMHLSNQGFNVFLSSHQVVRKYLASNSEFNKNDRLLVYPSIKLKVPWIAKLRDRYDHTGLDKDYKAWKNAESVYEENITALANSDGFVKVELTDFNYNLEDVLEPFNNDIIYFEVNNWFRGRDYPDTETFRNWMGNDLGIVFRNEEWVKKNKLCVIESYIDMSVNFCVTAKRDWVIENCPELLTTESDFLKYPDKDGYVYGRHEYSTPFLSYDESNIGITEGTDDGYVIHDDEDDE